MEREIAEMQNSRSQKFDSANGRTRRVSFFKFLIARRDARRAVSGRRQYNFSCRRRTRRRGEINEVLDTCLSPVARVFLPPRLQRRVRDTSRRSTAAQFLPPRPRANPRHSSVHVAYPRSRRSVSSASSSTSSSRAHDSRQKSRCRNLFLAAARRTAAIGPLDCSEIRF